MAAHTQTQSTELRANWAYRRQGFTNLLHMGHCAPTAMRTILDVTAQDEEWLVRLSAGMPGGIGNTGHECGAFTSPLVLMGIRLGLEAPNGEAPNGELPVIFEKGHALHADFLACHKTLQCKEIRGKDKFPLHCIAPVLRSAELYQHALQDGDPAGGEEAAIPGTGHPEAALTAERRAATTRLYSHLREVEFHCARAVLLQLGYTQEANPALFDAVSAFIGGTLFMGETCSAFTAGVMAAGLRHGEIENSIPRVVRLLAIMTVGGNAFDERLNKFNASMNWGYSLSKWMRKEFGSTQCRAITGCDFATMEGVEKFVEEGKVERCREVVEGVAGRVREEVEVRV